MYNINSNVIHLQDTKNININDPAPHVFCMQFNKNHSPFAHESEQIFEMSHVYHFETLL